MKFEIRSEGGACPSCGAGEIVYSGGAPVSADVTRVMEREIVRREVGMAKLLRDHLVAAEADQTAREDRLGEQFKSELWNLKLQHADQMDDVADRLEALKVDVAGWRLVRRRRERIFAERIDTVVQDMLAATTKGG